MLSGEPPQFGSTRACEPKPDLAVIVAAAGAFDEPSLGQTIGQANGAMRADQQVFRQLADSRTAGIAQHQDGQQHLMLLRLKVLGPGCFLAEVQKPADLVAKRTERLVVPS